MVRKQKLSRRCPVTDVSAPSAVAAAPADSSKPKLNAIIVFIVDLLGRGYS